MDLMEGRRQPSGPPRNAGPTRGTDRPPSRDMVQRMREDLSREVLNSTVDAYAALDSGGRVLEWNHAASVMLGWSRKEAIGQLMTELVGVSAEQREWVLQDMRKYVETGESLVVGGISSHVMRRKGGSELPVEVAVSPIGAGPELTFHVFIRDMTELSESRASDRGAEAMFKAVFDNAPNGIAVVGLDGSFQRVNRALCRITRYHERELTELRFQDITHPEDLDNDLNEATKLLNGEITSYEMEKRYYAKDGHLIWIHLSASMVSDDDGKPLYFIAQVKDISARKRDQEMLTRQATRDSLTGVLNRGRFQEELARYQALASRHSYTDEAAVFVIDLDGLKRVNDKQGHAAGDAYLTTVAHNISRRLRISDVFARTGGDEFAALLPHTPAAQARELATTLAGLVGAATRGSVSIGIAMLKPGHLDDALERADQAMYQAKKHGGGQVYGPL